MRIANSYPYKQPQLVFEPVRAFIVSGVILVKPELEKLITWNILSRRALRPTQVLSELFYMPQYYNLTQQLARPSEWLCIWRLFPRILRNNWDYLTFNILLLFLTDISRVLYSFTKQIFPIFLSNINHWIEFYRKFLKETLNEN